jgi:hypothetical protein
MIIKKRAIYNYYMPIKQLLFIISFLLESFCFPCICQQQESEHFKYYFEAQDETVIPVIKEKLENGYEKIVTDLQLNLAHKIDIRVYPDLIKFHQAINYPDAPDWIVGVGGSDIKIVSPLNPGSAHSYSYMIDYVLLHEFTHVCTYEINSSISNAWLLEGIAIYEAGPPFGDSASLVKSYNKFGKLPSFRDLEPFYSFADNNGYNYSITIIDYIVLTYGFDKLLMFLKNPDNYSIFNGCTKAELEVGWQAYFMKKYLGVETGLYFQNDDKIDIKYNINYHLLEVRWGDNEWSTGTLEIYELDGKVVQTSRLTKSQHEYWIDLTKGNYIFRVTFNSATKTFHKTLKVLNY